MWKCKNCGKVIKGSKFVQDGHCENCDQYFVLERYDPLFENKKTRGLENVGKAEN
ncbi:MAG: hypothetical protein ACOC1X_02105 [Promethearchaeota archaeon]